MGPDIEPGQACNIRSSWTPMGSCKSMGLLQLLHYSAVADGSTCSSTSLSVTTVSRHCPGACF